MFWRGINCKKYYGWNTPKVGDITHFFTCLVVLIVGRKARKERCYSGRFRSLELMFHFFILYRSASRVILKIFAACDLFPRALLRALIRRSFSTSASDIVSPGSCFFKDLWRGEVFPFNLIGRCWAVRYGLLSKIMALSMAFFNSRTFPGQS